MSDLFAGAKEYLTCLFIVALIFFVGLGATVGMLVFALMAGYIR